MKKREGSGEKTFRPGGWEKRNPTSRKRDQHDQTISRGKEGGSEKKRKTTPREGSVARPLMRRILLFSGEMEGVAVQNCKTQ